jgi:hypothetical protein
MKSTGSRPWPDAGGRTDSSAIEIPRLPRQLQNKINRITTGKVGNLFSERDSASETGD